MVAHLRFLVAVEASVVKVVVRIAEVVVRIAEPWGLASVLVALIVVLPAQAVTALAP
jgi:hypothetical protein